MPTRQKRQAPKSKAKAKAQPKAKAARAEGARQVKEESESSDGCEILEDNDAMLAAALRANDDEAVEKGGHEHQFRAPADGDRITTAFITRSWLTGGMTGYYQQVPTSKKEEISDVMKISHKVNQMENRGGKVDLGKMGVGVWSEPHREQGTHHHHIIVHVTGRTRRFHLVKEAAKSLKIAVDVRVPSGESGSSQLDRALTYVCVPTAAKFQVDLTPRLLNQESLKIPHHIWERQEAALQRLEKRSASTDDIFQFLLRNPVVREECDTSAALDAYCEKIISDKGVGRCDKIPFLGLRRWTSAREDRASAQYQTQRARAWKVANRGLTVKTFGDFVEEAAAAGCVCPSEAGFLSQLKESVTRHDRHEETHNRGSCAKLGEYFHLMGQGAFKDRKSCLLLIGSRGSGKSTVTRAMFNCLGKHAKRLVFKPCFDEGSFPWCGYDKEVCRFIDLNDLRLETLEKSTLLNIAEQDGETKVAQKGAYPVEIGDGKFVVITTNYVEPCGEGKSKWRHKDVEALLDRCFLGHQKGIQWKLPLPQEMIASSCQNALRSKCESCSAQFVRWCVATAKTQGRIPSSSGSADSCSGDEEEALRLVADLGFDDEP